MKSTVHRQLLFAHFSGHTTPLQQRLIEEWLTESSNQEKYYEYLEEWDRLNLQYHPDEERAWNKLQEQTKEFKPPIKLGRKKTFNYTIYWIAAASVFIVSLFVVGFIVRRQLLVQTIETGFGEVRKVTLPDGSVVTLNANSQLQFLRPGFGKLIRDVSLKGEATFGVRHLPTHQPFIMHIDGQLDVTVLGTEFTVYARKGAAQVVLHQGKVHIDYKGKDNPRQLTMLPGDIIKLDLNKRIQFKHLNNTEIYKAWQNQQFVFNKTSLHEIAQLM
jgi:transmembrane sensor